MSSKVSHAPCPLAPYLPSFAEKQPTIHSIQAERSINIRTCGDDTKQGH